jgi:hypothetical protein
MNDTNDLFKEIIRKTRLEQPISEDIRQFMHIVKIPVLIEVLRKAENYNFYYGILLLIFFRAKKMGFGISVVKCAYVFWITAALVLAGASAGAYISSFLINKQDTTVREETRYDHQKGYDADGNRKDPGKQIIGNENFINGMGRRNPEDKGMPQSQNAEQIKHEKNSLDKKSTNKKMGDGESQEKSAPSIPNL